MVTIYRATAQDLRLNILLYGSPGAGKTTLALTANDHPDLGPSLVLNFEGGLLSVVGRHDVDAVDIQTIDDLERVFWLFRENHESVNHYKTIIIDSGSELYTKALRETVNTNLGRRNNRKGDEDDFELEDYGRAGNQVFRLFSQFRDLPRHVIVTSTAKSIYPPNADANKNPNLEPKEVRPNFTTTLASKLEGVFDSVWYLYANDVEEPSGAVDDDGNPVIVPVSHRYLLTRAMGAYRAKTRGPSFAQALGDIVVDPTVPMLYDILLQAEGTDPVARAEAYNRHLMEHGEAFRAAAHKGQAAEAALPGVFGPDPDPTSQMTFDHPPVETDPYDDNQPGTEAVVEDLEEATV